MIMKFTVGMEKEKHLEESLKGHYQKVAVGCWFTSTGRGIPQMVKYEDEEGCLQMLNNIQIIRTGEKYYAGILSRRYDCRAVVDSQMRDFILIYNPETNIWDMVLPAK